MKNFNIPFGAGPAPFSDVSSTAQAIGLGASAAICSTLLDTYGGPPGSPGRAEAAQEILMGVRLALLGDIPAQIEKDPGRVCIRLRIYLVRQDFWKVDYVAVVAIQQGDVANCGRFTVAMDNGF